MMLSFRFYHSVISSFTKYSYFRLLGVFLTIFVPITCVLQVLFMVLLSFGQDTPSLIYREIYSQKVGIKSEIEMLKSC